MSPTPDPRPLFQRAIAQTGRIIDAVEPDQATYPTPCADFDVQALIAHTAWALQRVAAVATGGDAESVPLVAVEPDTWSERYADSAAAVRAAWADPALLDVTIHLPFATVPGRVAVAIYTMEVTAHGWDIAKATRQATELDADIAEAALATAAMALPAEPRGGEIPFGPVVAVGADAGPYARLVAYLGRQPYS